MARRTSDSGAGTGTLLLAILGLIAAFFILSAPYWLGTWVAVAMGAGLPSAERSILGWTFEIVALVALAAVAGRWVWVRTHTPDTPPAFDHATTDHVLAMMDGRVEPVQDDRIPRTERVLARFYNVDLIEPRSTGRGQPKAPTAVARGELMITTKAARFTGGSRDRVWKWKAVNGVTDRGTTIDIYVSGRAMLCGVRFPQGTEAAGRAAIDWSVATASGAGELALIAHQLRADAADAAATTARLTDPAAQPSPMPGRVVGSLAGALAATMLVSTVAVGISAEVSEDDVAPVVAEVATEPTEPAVSATTDADAEAEAEAEKAAAEAEALEAESIANEEALAEEAAGDSEAVTATDGTALAAVVELAVKGRAPQTGYDRDLFPHWKDPDGNGCDTRNDILARDLTGESLDSDGCTVLTGTVIDPYTAHTIDFTRGQATSGAVQIDHVVALGDAWQKGAQQISLGTREQFANDPLNLLAVDGPTNGSKGASDAASWLPPNKAFRCQYVARQVAVKLKYELWVTEAEGDAMTRVLTTCPDEALPAGGATVVVKAAEKTPEPEPEPVIEKPAPAPEPEPVVEKPAPAPEPESVSVYYKNCTAVRDAGANPIYAGDPGYSFKLDRDRDGIACE